MRFSMVQGMMHRVFFRGRLVAQVEGVSVSFPACRLLL